MFLLKAEGAVCKVAAPARPTRYPNLGFRPAAGGRCVPRFNSTDLLTACHISSEPEISSKPIILLSQKLMSMPYGSAIGSGLSLKTIDQLLPS